MRKNTKKQWIAILMTCVLSMGITACGSKEDTKKNVPETPTEQVQMTQNPKETEVAKQTEVPEDATEGDATSYYVKQYKEYVKQIDACNDIVELCDVLNRYTDLFNNGTEYIIKEI